MLLDKRNNVLAATKEFCGWIFLLTKKLCLSSCSTLMILIMCMLSGFSHVRLFVILWTEARQAALSVGFLMQEYWRGLPFPPPGDLPDPGTEPKPLALQADSLPLNHQGSPYTYYILLHKESLCILLNSAFSLLGQAIPSNCRSSRLLRAK